MKSSDIKPWRERLGDLSSSMLKRQYEQLQAQEAEVKELRAALDTSNAKLEASLVALKFYSDGPSWWVTFAQPKRTQDLAFLEKSPDWEYVTEDGRGHEVYYVTSNQADEALRKIEELEGELEDSMCCKGA